jgi:hypothetical protein
MQIASSRARSESFAAQSSQGVVELNYLGVG